MVIVVSYGNAAPQARMLAQLLWQADMRCDLVPSHAVERAGIEPTTAVLHSIESEEDARRFVQDYSRALHGVVVIRRQRHRRLVSAAPGSPAVQLQDFGSTQFWRQLLEVIGHPALYGICRRLAQEAAFIWKSGYYTSCAPQKYMMVDGLPEGEQPGGLAEGLDPIESHAVGILEHLGAEGLDPEAFKKRMAYFGIAPDPALRGRSRRGKTLRLPNAG